MATLRTSTHDSEKVLITFYNSGGSTRTVSLAENADVDVKFTIELLTGEFANVKCTLGNGDDIRAKQDAGTDVKWFIEEDFVI